MRTPGFLILESGVSEPVGVMHYRWQSPDIVFGEGIAVHHSSRGRGVAAAALGRFCEFAKGGGAKEVRFRAQKRVVGYYASKFGAETLDRSEYPLMSINL